MKCEYIKKIKDVLDILEEFDDPIESYPLTGAVYVGCYEDEKIVSLMCHYNKLIHFYVRKSHRRNARKYVVESEKLIPAYKFYIKIPDNKKLVNFTKKMGYIYMFNEESQIVMGKVNELY